VAAIAVVVVGQPTAAGAGATASVRPLDWPSYGHDALHSFDGQTRLTPASAHTLRLAWRFHTGDAVTATPTVAGWTVYAGSWDGYFYAVDLRTGRLRWKYRLQAQPAVIPYPGQNPRPDDSDGGLVTSSAWFEPADAGHPDLVIFGGGYTLYALDARTGALFWEHDYTGQPDLPPDPVHDGARIFSSPVVADGKVFIGVSVDGAVGYRGYIVAADLLTGDPVWELQTDADAQGQVLNDGCGDVWSSGTVLQSMGAVVFSTADCRSTDAAPMSESILALSMADGQVLWSSKPQRVDPGCDFDFGASVNAGLNSAGQPTFLGVGGKDGTYYSIDPTTGALVWSTNVVFGGSSGGFIGTTAYDGHHVYGSTALGELGSSPCEPGNPRDKAIEEPSVHAFDAATGAVVFQERLGQSFGPTTVAGGMTFTGLALDPVVEVRLARTGRLIHTIRLRAPCWSGIATAGNAIVFGTGSSEQGTDAGILAYTPYGQPPRP